MTSGIFVSYRGHLEGPRGGVQLCTQEYIEIIKAAGVDLRFCPFEGDRRLSTRILRRFVSSRYFRPAESAVLDTVAQLVAESRPEFVFLNQVALAPLAREIRQRVPSACKIVVLSHGLESTDLLHLIRLRRRFRLSGRVRPSAAMAVGQAILCENTSRVHVDLVFTLSSFDAHLEQWVGAACVGWLPRIVEPAPLDWRPVGTRLGFVGALDHAPNLEGLVEVLERLSLRNDTGGLHIRVIGGPTATGRWLMQKYPLVDYLGPLDDSELRDEARTWNGFLHPIFCHPRGCSTKLATAIAWEIPIVTTPPGHRGYTWKTGSLLLAETPDDFASICVDLLDRKKAEEARQEVAKLAASSPLVEDGLTGFVRRDVAGLVDAVGRVSEIDRLTCRRHAERLFSECSVVEAYLNIYRKLVLGSAADIKC
jgi:glycosyltransferase involved in cell wall biosynthesis